MEMLFAIAILLVGLVGVASVLGVAGRNAVKSRTLTESQIVANNALSTFLAYEMNRKSNWLNNSLGNTGVCIDPLFANAGVWFGPSGTANPINQGMLRVGLRIGLQNTISSKMYEKLFASGDELAVEKGVDSTIPVTRLFEQFGGDTFKSSSRETYSWFATIPWVANEQPHGQANNSSNGLLVSIVVVKNRDREELPVLLNVRPAVPDVNGEFKGEVGSALQVILEGLPSTGSVIKSGDWIMLSKRGNVPPFDSWYRIISIANEPEVSGNAYKATLAGRDLPPGTSLMTGTYVSGVVSVSERIVPILP
jgi:hypothetical protein